ncbi:MAG: nuclear transport factor 2 family protein [Fodinibius sp.]|nr:nuclear transport factor 2 family protein [Fodinibius sp.]
MRLLILCVIGLLTVSCMPEKDSSEDRATASLQIDELYQQFAAAYDSLDTDKVATLYAQDGYYLVSNPQRSILEGRPAIRKAFAGFIEGAAKNNRSLDISSRIISRHIAGSLAFDVGY